MFAMLQPVETMQGEDEEDTRLLQEMAVRARDYITSFRWCPPVTAMYFVEGIGYVVAIFLFEFDRKIGGTDDKLWVIVGDLPTAYMVVEPDESPQEVLAGYCLLMDEWVAAVRAGGGFAEVFPVEAARTEEHANMLDSRLKTLREEVIPMFSADRVTDANGRIIAKGES